VIETSSIASVGEGEMGEEISLSFPLMAHAAFRSRRPKVSPGGGGVKGKSAVLGVGGCGCGYEEEGSRAGVGRGEEDD